MANAKKHDKKKSDDQDEPEELLGEYNHTHVKGKVN